MLSAELVLVSDEKLCRTSLPCGNLARSLTESLEHQWTTGAHLALLREEQLQELGVFAKRVAAISCAHYGGIQSFPYREDVEQL